MSNEPLSAETIKNFLYASTATVSMQMLKRGFALVRDQDGHPVLAAADTRAGDTISIEFADGKVGAKVTDGAGAAPRPAAPPRRRDGGSGNQGSLL